jgi:hypothetical protein
MENLLGQLFDDEFYLSIYPDVAAAVEQGLYPNGEAHWRIFGHKEHRLTRPPIETQDLGGGIFQPSTFRYPYSSYGRLPKVDFAEPSLGPPEKDNEIVDRLITAWARAQAAKVDENLVDKSGMWSLPMRWNSVLFNALNKGDRVTVATVMSRMFQSQFTHGIAMGRSTAYMARLAPRQFSAQLADRIVRLAEALGIIAVRSPEQGDYAAPLDIDIDTIVASLEQELGVSFEFPQIGAPFGMLLREKVFPEIAFSHIYAAHLIKPHVRTEKDRVFEIGGGFGNLAYVLQKAAPCSYIIFDLPTTSLIQGYFLLKSDIAECVSLYGERPHKNIGIQVLPWWEIQNNETYDLAINQDSLPEMPPNIGAFYVKRIRNITRRMFISINQEQGAINSGDVRQTIVSRMMAAETSLHAQSRNLFWLRDGYVTELYDLRA